MTTRATATPTTTPTKTVYRSITAAFGLALALSLTACGDDASTDDGAAATERTATQSAPAGTDDSATGTGGAGGTGGTGGAGSPAAGADGVTAAALEAIKTAEASAGGTAYEIDDQDDDGTWEVDVRVGDKSVEVKVSADGKSVVESEDDDLDDEDRAGLDAASITLSDSIMTAIDEKGGVLDDAELEEENGTHYWEVTVDGTDSGDDVEVKIDVTNGSVIGS